MALIHREALSDQALFVGVHDAPLRRPELDPGHRRAQHEFGDDCVEAGSGSRRRVGQQAVPQGRLNNGFRQQVCDLGRTVDRLALGCPPCNDNATGDDQADDDDGDDADLQQDTGRADHGPVLVVGAAISERCPHRGLIALRRLAVCRIQDGEASARLGVVSRRRGVIGPSHP